jgi:hypothetical protein
VEGFQGGLADEEVELGDELGDAILDLRFDDVGHGDLVLRER